jgi:hypothetical protein
VPEKPKIAPVEKDNESGKWWVGIFEKHKEESATAKVNFESAAKDPNLAWALKAFNIDEHGKPLDPDKEGKSKQ